jgi:iron complex transport system substrate-binding protein
VNRLPRLAAIATAAVLTLAVAACGSAAPAASSAGSATPPSSASVSSASVSSSSASSAPSAASDAAWTPVTITGALGTATITEKPERVATVNWANQEVPLALGIVPVGMAAANFGDDDKDGLLPWVKTKLDELGGTTPVLFDETDGIDFEGVADTHPDVILAAYSGLTKEDYDTLSTIAPVVAYPEVAWGTPWRDMIEVSSKALGKEAQGKALIADFEAQMAAAVAKHPQLKDKSAMFLTHVDPTDLSQVSFYTTHDTRAMFFTDLGLATPKSIATASASTDKFSLTQSAEQADAFADVDIIVTYGDDALVKTLQADPLLSQIPAVKKGAIVKLANDPLGTAANPTPLAIPFVLDDYVALLAAAADKADQA